MCKALGLNPSTKKKKKERKEGRKEKKERKNLNLATNSLGQESWL
jgi:hypothetical protein